MAIFSMLLQGGRPAGSRHNQRTRRQQQPLVFDMERKHPLVTTFTFGLQFTYLMSHYSIELGLRLGCRSDIGRGRGLTIAV